MSNAAFFQKKPWNVLTDVLVKKNPSSQKNKCEVQACFARNRAELLPFGHVSVGEKMVRMDVIAKKSFFFLKKKQVRLLRTVRCEHSKISSVRHRLLSCDVASGFWVFQCGTAPLPRQSTAAASGRDPSTSDRQWPSSESTRKIDGTTMG